MDETTTKEEYQAERQMSKAASLAMQLSKEKARLQRELEELQHDFEVVAPSTPTGGPDSYLKWVGVLFAVGGIFMQSAGFILYGQICYLLGAIAWTLVGVYWNDKAVMLGSVIPATATALSIAQKVFGV